MNRLIWHGDRVLRKIDRDSAGVTGRISEIIADKARGIVTVLTGRLKRSIRATDTGIVVEEDYAAAVELGTATRAAKPFMRPAIERFNKTDLDKSVI